MEWTFNSPSTVMMKIGRGKGRKALKLKLGMKITRISEQTEMGKEVFKIKPPSDLQLLEQRLTAISSPRKPLEPPQC